MGKVHGNWTNGEFILKDKKGFYIWGYNDKKGDFKKRPKGLKKRVETEKKDPWLKKKTEKKGKRKVRPLKNKSLSSKHSQKRVDYLLNKGCTVTMVPDLKTREVNVFRKCK